MTYSRTCTDFPGDLSATLIRAISGGEWIVESIVGVGQQNDLIYFTGTYKSPLEKHLYTLPIVKPSSSSSQWNNVASDNDWTMEEWQEFVEALRMS